MNLEAITRILSRKQIRSIADSARVRISIWAGAVRSGKTIASLIAFLIALAVAPNHGLVVIVGRTLQTIERNIIEPLQDVSLFGALANQVHHTRGSTTAVILGRTVHLLGAHDAKAEGKLRGLTACLAYVDEATLIPQAFFQQLLARLSVPGARLLATTNPDSPAHWLRKHYLLRAGELNLASWHFTMDDNPSLSPEFVADQKLENVGLFYRRNILGEWCLAEGAIYEAWNPDRHMVDILPRIHRWYGVGIDVGTTNPFAALALGLGYDTDRRPRLYLTHEYRHDSKLARRQLTNPEYSDNVRTWLATADRPHETERGIRPEWLYIDPSAADFSLQLYRDGVSNVANAINDVIPGIRTLAGVIARDQLRVHRSCKGFLDEVPGYSWDDKASERGEDAPIKADDHSLDAVRYVVHSTETLWRPQLALEAA
ncbi:PBSX family phage terminase large subunit [Crossiella sp. SN42]|uniref:PBSX family phage terminase large subunit n=1 Tax=Crossiella sp. SN42 TaxID=2944808 RepID=UPI00207CD5CF|nr:PBSX family phage terminase large subunit [Crossiella sp. SN42]MCO1575016.1 PBSX family phage terminase large subunit [Crossiella sp. SN42]